MQLSKALGALALASAVAALTGCGVTTSKSASPSSTTTASWHPAHAITVVIPYPPGGASDIIARIVNQFAVPVFGHHFIFRYDPGAGGALGATDIADAPPNGYTIGTVNFPEITVQPLAGVGNFKPSSFDYLAQMVGDPQTIATLKGSQYPTLASLVAAARKNPGRVTVGIPTTLDNTQFVLLDLEKDAHVKFTIIPYTGGAPETAALLGNHIDAAMVNFSVSKPIAPEVNFLAVSAAKPFKLLPGVKTFAEQGYPIVTDDGRLFVAPKGLPSPVLATLRQGFKKIYDNPKFQALMKKDSQPTGYLSGSAAEQEVVSYQKPAYALLKEFNLLKQ